MWLRTKCYKKTTHAWFVASMVIIHIISQTFLIIDPSSLTFTKTPLLQKLLSSRKSTLQLLPQIPPTPSLWSPLPVSLPPYRLQKIPMVYPDDTFITENRYLNLSQFLSILRMTYAIAHFSSSMNLLHRQTNSLSNWNISFMELSIGSKTKSWHLKPLNKVT